MNLIQTPLESPFSKSKNILSCTTAVASDNFRGFGLLVLTLKILTIYSPMHVVWQTNSSVTFITHKHVKTSCEHLRRTTVSTQNLV